MNDKVGLGLSTASDATFETFFVGENEHTLRRAHDAERVWLYGERAVGKTHVLHAFQAESDDTRLIDETPLTFADDATALLLIDDIDAMCGNEENEYALFAAYEATDFGRSRWVVAAEKLPSEVSFLYRDLASRMAMFEQLELLPVPESSRGELLKFWAKDREISLADEVIAFLLDRIPRTQESLWLTLQKLDHDAILESRELTIPFVRHVLGFDRT